MRLCLQLADAGIVDAGSWESDAYVRGEPRLGGYEQLGRGLKHRQERPPLVSAEAVKRPVLQRITSRHTISTSCTTRTVLPTSFPQKHWACQCEPANLVNRGTRMKIQMKTAIRGAVSIAAACAVSSFGPEAVAQMSGAGTFEAFGPQTYVRSQGKPVSDSRRFSVLDPTVPYTIEVHNGGAGGRKKISNAKIKLNGVEIVGPSEFGQNVDLVQKSVQLHTDNELTVELKGKPGGTLSLSILGVDNGSPEIVAAVTPKANSAGWHRTAATVTFDCTDATSGIQTCPEPKVVDLDGAGQLITGTAVDLAGNEATASVTINVDRTPPTISSTNTPAPNLAGWNNTDVKLIFSCQDRLSGVSSCSDPETVSSEGFGQAFSGTAVDLAGNIATATVTLNVDMTPPALAPTSGHLPGANGFPLTWPPADHFGTDLAHIEIVGTITDGLSGVRAATLADIFGSDVLTLPDFAELRNLRTDIPAGKRSIDNVFEIDAVDEAGNVAELTFHVRHTLSTTMAPTDTSRTEVSADGVLTSTDRALVRFQPRVGRSTIHDIVQQAGGRVAGHLSVLNAAMVIFETDHLAELEAKLLSLRSKNEVLRALPVEFLETLADDTVTYDNDALTPWERRAYDSVNLSTAADYIIHEGLPLRTTSVAIIDNGLDLSFGRNQELRDIDFYDICTPEGQEGQLGTPAGGFHGTTVTGVLAGANNGEGNNGVIRGIPGSDFHVKSLGVSCFGSNPTDPTILVAMELIVEGVIGDVDVVNMSFGRRYSSGWEEDYAEYIDSARGQEVLWVGAAGNGGSDYIGDNMSCDEPSTLVIPAGLACTRDNVVSVGSYVPITLMRSSESNYGAITLSAPGSGFLTATPSGYAYVSPGTSYSAPFVSGASALLLAATDMTPALVKESLIQTTQPLNDADLPEGGLDVLSLIQTVPLPPLRYLPIWSADRILGWGVF